MPHNANEVRIAIIDDEASVCEGLAFQLRFQYSFKNIVTYIRPTEALEKLEAAPESIDVVLLDLKMPGLDGFEVLAAIKQINPKIQVIIVSACSTIIEIRSALQAMALVFSYQDETGVKQTAILEKGGHDLQRLPELIHKAFAAKLALDPQE